MQNESNKTERKTKAIALVVLAFFALLIYFILRPSAPVLIGDNAEPSLFSGDTKSSQPLELEETDSSVNEEIEEISISSSKLYALTPEIKKQYLDSKDGEKTLWKKNNSISSQEDDTLASTKIKEIVEENRFEEESIEEDFVSEKIEQTTILDTPSLEQDENNSLGTTTKSDTEILDKKPDIREEGNCIIIIGAFKEKKNVQKLQARLEYAGYNVYTSQGNHLVYIGVKTNCEKSSLQSKLKQLRHQFAPDAYIKKAN